MSCKGRCPCTNEKPKGCTLDRIPVCGKDGISYDSSCAAMRAGTVTLEASLFSQTHPISYYRKSNADGRSVHARRASSNVSVRAGRTNATIPQCAEKTAKQPMSAKHGAAEL